METLVVVSKIKKYVKATADMNTSATAIDALTKVVQNACEKAIYNARGDGRKTIMDRDFED